jgi:hypothetical protein
MNDQRLQIHTDRCRRTWRKLGRERARARERDRDKGWSFMFVSLFRSSVVIDRVVLLSLGFMWLCLFWNCWLDLLFFVLSSFYWVVAAFIVVHEIKTVLFSDFYKQLSNQWIRYAYKPSEWLSVVVEWQLIDERMCEKVYIYINYE